MPRMPQRRSHVSPRRYRSRRRCPANIAIRPPAARNGAKGIASFRARWPYRASIAALGTTARSSASMRAIQTDRPSIAPSRSASLTSPIPIPPGYAIATMKSAPAAATAPSAHSGEGSAIVRNASTATAAGSTTRFGTIRNSRSVAVTTTSAAQKIAAAAAVTVRPKAKTQSARSSAVTSSIAGSRGGIRVPQRRQRPRSSTYETSGTLSRRGIGARQPMHAEPGRTTDRRSGTRAATTPRKLPTASPGASAREARKGCIPPFIDTRAGSLEGFRPGSAREVVRPARELRLSRIADRERAGSLLDRERRDVERGKRQRRALADDDRVRTGDEWSLYPAALTRDDVGPRVEAALERRAVGDHVDAVGCGKLAATPARQDDQQFLVGIPRVCVAVVGGGDGAQVLAPVQERAGEEEGRLARAVARARAVVAPSLVDDRLVAARRHGGAAVDVDHALRRERPRGAVPRELAARGLARVVIRVRREVEHAGDTFVDQGVARRLEYRQLVPGGGRARDLARVLRAGGGDRIPAADRIAGAVTGSPADRRRRDPVEDGGRRDAPQARVERRGPDVRLDGPAVDPARVVERVVQVPAAGCDICLADGACRRADRRL